jgi:hypothetical protein
MLWLLLELIIATMERWYGGCQQIMVVLMKEPTLSTYGLMSEQ